MRAAAARGRPDPRRRSWSRTATRDRRANDGLGHEGCDLLVDVLRIDAPAPNEMTGWTVQLVHVDTVRRDMSVVYCAALDVRDRDLFDLGGCGMRYRESRFDPTLGSAVSDAAFRIQLSGPNTRAAAGPGVSRSLETVSFLFGPKYVAS